MKKTIITLLLATVFLAPITAKAADEQKMASSIRENVETNSIGVVERSRINAPLVDRFPIGERCDLDKGFTPVTLCKHVPGILPGHSRGKQPLMDGYLDPHTASERAHSR